MKTIISLIAGLCLASFVAAQCIMPSANFTYGNLFADPLSQWEYVNLYGNQSHDGFWFDAQKETIYLFTTLDEFGAGGAAGDDYQITILDAQGYPAPGEYGNAFHDDVNYSGGESDPMLIWSPVTSGSYKVLLTRYQIGGCNEISPSDVVRVGYRGFMTASSHVAVWTGVKGQQTTNGGNWMHVAVHGQQLGYPSSSNAYQFIMDSQVPAQISSTMSILCDELFLGTHQQILMNENSTLDIGNRLFNPLAGSFFGAPAVGSIKSTDPQKPGIVKLSGAPYELVSAGQFQDIRLWTYTDVKLHASNSMLVSPCRLIELQTHADDFWLGNNCDLEIVQAIRLNKNNSSFTVRPNAVLLMRDEAEFILAGQPQGGGVKFEGGTVRWEAKQRGLRRTPFLHNTSERGYIGFEFGDTTNTMVDVAYFTYPTPNQSLLQSPVQKVSSREHFVVDPDGAAPNGRIVFQYHGQSGINSNATQNLVLAGNNSQSKWEALQSGAYSGIIDAFQFNLNDYSFFAPATTGNGHSFRQTSEAVTETFSFDVYPNPAREFVNIKTTEKGELSMLSIDGKTLLKQELGVGESRIPLGGFTSGEYFLRLRSESSTRTAKLKLQ